MATTNMYPDAPIHQCKQQVHSNGIVSWLLPRIILGRRMMLYASAAMFAVLVKRPRLVVLACIIIAETQSRNYFVVPMLSQDTSENPLSNTNWRNVLYQSGVFGRGPLWQEEIIRKQCAKLDGAEYFDDQYGDRYGNNSVCMGPLATNATCCYCYFSRDYEKLQIERENKYWSCAVARNNSLLPLNSTRIDTKGGRVALVTGMFGHNNSFQNEVEEYCQEVRALNLVKPQDVYCYGDSPDYVLQNPKFSRHLRYRTDPNDLSARGGGFYFHKSVIMRHLFDLYNDGDYMVYTDTDRFDFFQQGTFNAVLETLAKRGDDLCVEFMGNAVENLFTKEDVLAAFNASKYMRESPQVLANAIVVRNSPAMKQFLDAWVECMAYWHMVSDEPSVLPNAPHFWEHRHDQSLLSLLIKNFMTEQVVVQPPARAYQPLGNLLTFKFRWGSAPTCPFASFYASRNSSMLKA